jgi:hypothetical protein
VAGFGKMTGKDYQGNSYKQSENVINTLLKPAEPKSRLSKNQRE